MTDLTPTPIDPSREPRIETFATLMDALDSASGGVTGMNFHGPRGDLIEVVSYAALSEQARNVGSRLLSLGLEAGDRVGLIAETHADFVRAFMGSLYAGLCPCPMPLPAAFGAKDSYGHQIRKIGEVADFRAVITPEEYLEWIEEPLGERDLLHLGPISGLPEAGSVLTANPGPDDLAYLQFSSGTTGAPKGVAVTHRSLMANLYGMQQVLELTGRDRGMSWLPFYHDMGLVGCMLLPLAAHFSIDYLATRDFIRRPGLWPTMISRAEVSLSYSPSFGYELAARRGRNAEGLSLKSWRIAGIGGDMIRAGNLSEFTETYAPHGFDRRSFTPSYGMAELTLGLTFSAAGAGCRTHRLSTEALSKGLVRNSDDDTRAQDFAICGKPLPGHQIELRRADGSKTGEREIGKVFAYGPSLMKGYFRDPEATAECLDEAGWLDTGDIGFIDENGELVLTGRAKDLIIVNGRNIWPQDIEWTMEQRIQGIRDGSVAAFGINSSHNDTQEQLTVVIEHRNGQKESAEAISEEVDALLRQVYQLSPVVALSRPGSLPRTSSGKLSRSKAREMYLAGLFDS
ncbi:MAG: fatty acyl-AMP ligase [Pseudomonadota bacterium]